MTQIKLGLAFVLALSLAACASEREPNVDDGNQDAKGEILGGTISDAMLPLESVTSQSPPLAGQDRAPSEPAGNDAVTADDAGEASTPPEEAPAPAEAAPATALSEG